MVLAGSTEAGSIPGMATSDPIRIGIIGAGAITLYRHIPGLKAIDGVTITSICNRSRASSERVASEHGIERIYDHWRDLVHGDDTDAVMIGTWPYLHRPITLAALEAGKHVFTQARMAMNATEAREMLAAARSHPHLVTQICPPPHTLKVDKTVKRLIAEGYLGEVLAARIVDAGAFIDRDAPLHWRQDEALSGLNVLALGMLYECVSRWLGPATRLTAMGHTFVKSRRTEEGSLRATPIPDHLGVFASLASGAQLPLGPLGQLLRGLTFERMERRLESQCRVVWNELGGGGAEGVALDRRQVGDGQLLPLLQ